MDDNRFWELVDAYESKQMTKDEVIEEICRSTKSFDVAIADFALLIKRTVTKDEKNKIRELIDAKNIKRNNKRDR